MWTLDKQPWEGSLWEGLKNSPRIFDKQTLYNSMEFMKRKSKRWIIQCTQFEKCWALDFGRNLVWWSCCGQKLDWWAKLSGSERCAVLRRFTFSRTEKESRFVPFIFRSYVRLRDQISDCIFLRSRTVFSLKPGWFQRGFEKKFCCHQLQLAAGNEDNLEPLCKKQQR